MSVLSDAMEINPLNWGIQQLSSGLQSITVTPIKDIISYAVPWIKASVDRHVYVTNDNRPLAKLIGGAEVVDSLKEEIDQLAKAAGVKGDIFTYTSLGAPFSGYAGLDSKVVTLPLEHIHQKMFDEVKTDEHLLTDEELEETKWEFTENETRFLMSKSMAELSIFPFLRVIARISILVLMIGLFFTPLNLYAGGAAFCAGGVLYFAIDRMVGIRVNGCAQEILQQRFEDAGMGTRAAGIQSAAVGINTLKKIQLQQLDIRSRSKLCKALIDSEGDIRFDFTVPALKNRIRRLEKRQAELFKQQAIKA